MINKDKKINDDRDMPIFNFKMAGYLMFKGFVVSSIKPNKNMPNKKVYYFRISPELINTMNEWLESQK